MAVLDPTTITNPQLVAGSPQEMVPIQVPPPNEALTAFWYGVDGVRSIVTDTEDRMLYEILKGIIKKFRIKQVLRAQDYSFFVEPLYDCSQFIGLVGSPNSGRAISTSGSATLCSGSTSLINTPYHGTDEANTLNGIDKNPTNPGGDNLVYTWTPYKGAVNYLHTAEDGYVLLDPLPRTKLSVNRVSMYAPRKESDAGWEDKANLEVNAFTLSITILPGADVGTPAPVANGDPPPPLNDWFVRCYFGDVYCELTANRPEMKVVVAGSDYWVRALPTDPNELTYNLTFIPVWNGLIFSDQLPSVDNWGSTTVYLPKDPGQSFYSALTNYLMSLEVPDFPRWGNLPGSVYMYEDETSYVHFGDVLHIDFECCGGRFKFLPVYFTPAMRTHYPIRGNGEVLGALMTPTLYTPNSMILGGNPSINGLANGTYWVLSQEIIRTVPGFRRPVETWGMLYYTLTETNIVRIGEGTLTEFDFPYQRITNVSINRSLDGTNGTATWDRADPVNGTIPRPFQAVGALRLGIEGGVDTQPGVIYTGIAMGNGEQDDENSNSIEVPLLGRECKMTDSENGIRLLNTLFFDGIDHNLVTQYLCNYAGIPFVSAATPWKLPSGTLQSPVVNFQSGRTVWDAIQSVMALAGTIGYIDRFGVFRLYDVGQTTGMNWVYPDANIVSYNDRPDLTTIKNAIAVLGLVSERLAQDPDKLKDLLTAGLPLDAEIMMVFDRVETFPTFAWDKMLFLVVPGIITPAQLNLIAARLITIESKPRATAQTTIPGNANIELLDTFNGNYIVTSVNHNGDFQSKRWTTSLGLELRLASLFTPQTGGQLILMGDSF
jgi:hypothetical protein